ncbi:MAG: hypothetical protein JNM82_10875 [Rhodocyclaceae bacterium]|nr:hypothetical protein [Rhodocyclaceae bacterium]
MHRLSRPSAWLAAAALAGCATPEPPVAERLPEPQAPESRSAPQAAARRPPAGRPSRLLDGRVVQAQPNRPLNVLTRCEFRDETGYGGRLDLHVAESEVRRFEARVDIPRRGICRFDLREFRQAGTAPVALRKERSNCAVRLWEQDGRVTVSFLDCRSQCSNGSADYLWPILVDAGSGRCS